MCCRGLHPNSCPRKTVKVPAFSSLFCYFDNNRKCPQFLLFACMHTPVNVQCLECDIFCMCGYICLFRVCI